MGRLEQQETDDEVAAILSTEQVRSWTEEAQVFLSALLARWLQEQSQLTKQQEDAYRAYEGMRADVKAILHALTRIKIEKTATYEKDMVARLHGTVALLQEGVEFRSQKHFSREYCDTEKRLYAELITEINRFL